MTMQQGYFGADTRNGIKINDLENWLDLTFNHGVVGSNPAGLASEIKHL
jgi:hypothetical protein